MKKKLLLLSFIEGAAVMAAELCGAKLLAPIFGSSLYVWASVLAITLAALAAGYFFGGVITEKKQQQRSLFLILIVASVFLLLMPAISYFLVPRISYFPFLPAVIISTFTLLFFPVFLLGASSPLFIFLQTESQNASGKVSGSVYAISTLGGIIATFFTGFFSIPELGLNITLIIFGVLLFIATVIVFKRAGFNQVVLFAGTIFVNLQFVAKADGKLFASDSILGHLEVEQNIHGDKEIRLLKINSIVQTEMNMSDRKSVSGYINLLDSILPVNQQKKESLVLGLGGGLTANLLLEKNYSVTGVEFDERIIDCAYNFFFLDSSVKSINEDARYFINHCREKYDLILIDVFKAEEQPSHVLTTESLVKLKAMMNDSCMLLVNWHGYVKGENGKGTSIVYNTLKNEGFNVQLLSFSADENYRNIIFRASLTSLPQNKFGLNEKLFHTDLINTDNHPLLEKYNAKANKLWRSNYLRYYQSE